MRFNTLDGLRGFAAILVLFYHLGDSAPITAGAGYLAVDLFFALSGFVIAHAYEDRLRVGLTLREFVVLRLMRVYPMAFIGAAIGALLAGRHITSLLLVPDFGGAGALFPANVPLWSLLLELVVNMAFAAVALRLGWRGLALVVAVGGAILVVGATRYHLGDLGPFWETVGYGLARTVFSFALGVGMHRIHARFAVRRRATRLASLLPVGLVVLLTTVPAGRPAWDLVCVFILLPTLLWLGTLWEVPDSRLFEQLGGLSYPLYCIHGVIIQASAGMGGAPAYLWLLLIAAAWWLNSRIDVPLRRWLMCRWKQQSAALAPV